jgi:hypothetical protein
VRSEIEVGNRTNPLSPNSHNELKSTRRAAAVLKSIVMIVFAIFYGWRGTGYEACHLFTVDWLDFLEECFRKSRQNIK